MRACFRHAVCQPARFCAQAHATHAQHMVPRGLEPRTLRLLAVRSNQLSYETVVLAAVCRMWLPARLWEECCCQFAMRSVPVTVYGRFWGYAPTCRQWLFEVLLEELGVS